VTEDTGGDGFGSAEDGQLVVSMQPEGVLVEGDERDVEHYIARLREMAPTHVDVTGIGPAAAGRAAGLVAGGASFAGQSAKFVQLSADSVKALKTGRAIPGDPGLYRMMTRGADGKFLKQLQWKSTSLSPQRLISVQMIAVQIGLTTAIAQVDESVRRVEGKVDAVLALAEANRAGDVIGNHTTVARLVRYLDKNGSLPDALWESVAGLGTSLAATVEQLRNYAGRVLAALDPSQESLADRATALRNAIKNSKFGETLDLLIVAEESLYLWQRLLIARVGATQRDHLETVIEDSRHLLREHFELDGQLYQKAKAVIEETARRDDLDGFRFITVQKLTHDRDTLGAFLDDFARARRHQAETWKPLEDPGVLEAASASVEKAVESTGRVIAGAGAKLIKIGDYLVERERRQQAADGAEPDKPAEKNG
jgi:hypothetical protein